MNESVPRIVELSPKPVPNKVRVVGQSKTVFNAFSFHNDFFHYARVIKTVMVCCQERALNVLLQEF